MILVLLAMISLNAASTFAAAPAISVFSPASGTLNTTVTITGTNFVSPVKVSFGGVASTAVAVVSSTSVKARLPFGATTGAITLVTSGGSAASAAAFTVLPGLSVSTTLGPPTTAQMLFYSGFGASEAVDIYFDAEDIALGVTSANCAGSIPIAIPADARPGSHWITAVGRRSDDPAQVAFTVRTDWPQLGFQPNRKAKNRYENVLSAATAGDLDEAWRTPQIAASYSTPAVANGIVYATFRDSTIRAFDETTGAQKWSFQTGQGLMYSSPAVANGIVYAGSDDGNLYALDAVTGQQIWRYVNQKYYRPIQSSPNVANGIVYFGGLDNNVYALNAANGGLVWTYGASAGVYAAPMVANGVVYVGSEDNNVYALNAATGAKIWQFNTGGGVYTTPAPAGGLICVCAQTGIVYALRASTGAVAWSYTASAYAITGSPASVGGAIFFGDQNGSVYSLSSGGALRWSTALVGGGGHGTITAPVCVANGVVYATVGAYNSSYAAEGNYTCALDQNTGALLTTLPVGTGNGGTSSGGPVVVNGAVFIADNTDDVLTRYTPNGLLSNYVAPRPDPMQLRPHPLR